jgi:hypothetical protein
MIKTNSTYVNISDSYGVSFSTTLKTKSAVPSTSMKLTRKHLVY